MRLKPFTCILLSASTLSWGYEILAAEPAESQLNSSIEITSRIEHSTPITGIGGAKVLIPLTQSQEAVSDLWFAHVQSHYRASTENKCLEASFGAGIGYRLQLDPELQIGAYGLFDMRIAASRKQYYLFTPGLEVQTSQWHLNLSGYIPVGTSSAFKTEEKWGHELGVHTHHHLTGHTEKDHRYKEGEAIPMGIDLNGSWALTDQFSVSLGGYYLQYSKEVVHPGIRAGLSYRPIPTLRIEVQGQYEKEPQIWTQLHFTLGSDLSHASDNRLYAPIQQPIIPMRTLFDQGEEKLVNENIDFYGPQGNDDTGDGSFENPYGLNIDQSKVNQMEQGASIYLAEGAQYKIITSNTPTSKNAFSWIPFTSSQGANSNQPAQVLLLKNKSLIGRSADFRTLASEDKKPILSVPLNIAEGGTSEQPIHIQNISIQFNNAWKPAISISSAKHIQLKAIQINSEDPATHHLLKTGLAIHQGENISILNSSIFAQENPIAMNGAKSVEIIQNHLGSLNNAATTLIGAVISGGRNITLTENSFILSNNKNITGLSLDSSPAELTIKSNTFKVSQSESTSSAVSLLGIKSSNMEGITNNDFTFNTKASSTSLTVKTARTADGEVELLGAASKHQDDQGNTFIRESQ